MSRKILHATLVLVALGAVACNSENSTGPNASEDEIVGTWVSAGSNVAPGLVAAPFLTDSIIATFNDNGSYLVTQWSGGASVQLTGTYTVGSEPEGQIRSIIAVQVSPSAVTSQGIFQVTGSAMEYEIIQVAPALQGVNAPTVGGGFGSTTVNGVSTGTYWIQNYVRRD